MSGGCLCALLELHVANAIPKTRHMLLGHSVARLLSGIFFFYVGLWAPALLR